MPNYGEKLNAQFEKIEFDVDSQIQMIRHRLDDIASQFKKKLKQAKNQVRRLIDEL
jgi:hypothetical protein